MQENHGEAAITTVDPRTLLTAQQLTCVRLEHLGPSKVIARSLGLSPHTVDDHFRQATRRLGVRTRGQAAELVRHWDANLPPHAWGDQSPAVAIPAGHGSFEPSAALAPMPDRPMAREDRAPYGEIDPPAFSLSRLTRMWLRRLGDELTTGNVLRGILWTALLVSLITAVIFGLGIVVQHVIINLNSGR